MTDQLQGVVGFAGDDLDGAVALNLMRQIENIAIDLDGKRGLRQARPDRRRQLCPGHGAVEVFHAAVRQRNRHIAHDIFIAPTG